MVQWLHWRIRFPLAKIIPLESPFVSYLTSLFHLLNFYSSVSTITWKLNTFRMLGNSTRWTLFWPQLEAMESKKLGLPGRITAGSWHLHLVPPLFLCELFALTCMPNILLNINNKTSSVQIWIKVWVKLLLELRIFFSMRNYLVLRTLNILNTAIV